ncbi:hypothetical protein [Bacillus sp. JCM 19034]|uniref:hypothetical protein n=1 Tax=Bacillus sp. JCM 19034 TaxID=1481928 RepID=UPI000A6CF366|nr:hypothetical protein [Bacillus sp. JCM 19034]
MNSNCIIHGSWIEQSFFIWGECSPTSRFEQKGNFQYPFLYSPFELKLRLFRKDPISFYGTFIEEGRGVLKAPIKERRYQSFAGEATIYQATTAMKEYPFPIEGLCLSIESLLSYISLFKCWHDDDAIILAPDFKCWFELFTFVKKMIQQGYFEPTTEGTWQLTQFPLTKWYNSLPKAAKAVYPVRSHISINDEGMTLANFEAMIQKLTDHWIRSIIQKKDITPLFHHWLATVDDPIKQTVKTLQTDKKHSAKMPVQEFNITAGITASKPFRSGLVLEEPKTEDEAWTISLCMVDRKHTNRVIKMEQLQLGEHPWHENPIAQLKEDVQNLREQIPLLKPLRISSPSLSLTSEETFDLFMNEDEVMRKLGFHLIIPK